MRRLVLISVAIIATAIVIPRALLPVDVARSAPDAPLSAFATLPTEAIAGQGNFYMKVYGDGFPADVIPVPLVFVVWNGVPLPAIMKSSTELMVEISRDLVASRGSATVGVLINGPGGPSVTLATPFRIGRSSSDVNCDGVVSAEDGLLILRVLAQTSVVPGGCSADANNDGTVDVADAIWARSEVAGLISQPLRSIKP